MCRDVLWCANTMPTQTNPVVTSVEPLQEPNNTRLHLPHDVSILVCIILSERPWSSSLGDWAGYMHSKICAAVCCFLQCRPTVARSFIQMKHTNSKLAGCGRATSTSSEKECHVMRNMARKNGRKTRPGVYLEKDTCSWIQTGSYNWVVTMPWFAGFIPEPCR